MKTLDPRRNLEYYNANTEELTNRYLLAHVDVLHKELLVCFTGCNRLLEVGSGSGRDAVFLLNQAYGGHRKPTRQFGDLRISIFLLKINVLEIRLIFFHFFSSPRQPKTSKLHINVCI